jgi:hypothetical protein
MMIALTDVRTSLREACREIRMRNPRGDVEPLLAKSSDRPPRKSSREWSWCPYQNRHRWVR